MSGWTEAHAKRFGTPVERLMRQVEFEPNGGCWIFSGPEDGHGYGAFWLNGRLDKAHRASWILHRGPIAHGTVVMHRCDVPACVNPDHLALGSQADNLADMRNKGRGISPIAPRGEANHLARLRETHVQEIRKRATAGENQYTLAAAFGVSQYAIWAIIHRKTWKHVQ